MSLLPRFLRVFFLRICLLLIGILGLSRRLFRLRRRLQVLLVFELSIQDGGFVIQSGMDLAQGNSFLLHEAQLCGASGKCVAVEPDPRNIELAHQFLGSRKFGENCQIVTGALSDQSGKMNMWFGAESKWNMLENVGHHDDDEAYSAGTGDKIHYREEPSEVAVKKIDDLVQELDIDPKRVQFLSLQINGSEFQALKGAEELLKLADDLVVFVATGRQFEGELGYIDGELDYEVIAEFLTPLGYDSQFLRMFNHPTKFGFLVASKRALPSQWSE